MESFKGGDILYHNTENFEWVIVYSHQEGDKVVGREYVNLKTDFIGYKYSNSYTNILRKATEREKEKIFEKFPNLNPKVMSKIISSKQAHEIIEAACVEWSEKLASKWAKNIILKREVEVSEEFYEEMRKACTTSQNKLFDKIFGVYNPYKKGEWIFIGSETSIWNSVVELIKIQGDNFYALNKQGKEDFVDKKAVERLATEEEVKKAKCFPDGTPCLVKFTNSSDWRLRYADGKGEFYADGKKEGVSVTFDFYRKLDINNLPVM